MKKLIVLAFLAALVADAAPNPKNLAVKEV
jgi:hypothetical protein